MPRRRRQAATTIHLGPPDLRVAALLSRIRRTGSLRKAARALGIAPGNAHRILQNEARRLGVRLLAGSRGGSNGGGSRLTGAGLALSKRGRDMDAVSVTWWPCRVIDAPARGSPWRVQVPGADVTAFVAPVGRNQKPVRRRPGVELELGIVPEAVTILPKTTRVQGSARNVWPARVAHVGRETEFGVRYLDVAVGAMSLAVTVTSSAILQMRLTVGSNVLLALKATSLRLRESVR